MKKIFCCLISTILLYFCLFYSFCVAEADPEVILDEKAFLSSATPADLINLRDQINNALLTSAEYESVPVPAGIYIVGEDIPEGKWTLSCDVRSSMSVGTKLKDNGQEIDTYDSTYYANSRALHFLYGHLYKDNQLLKTLHQTIDLPANCYVIIDNGTVNFTTYTGKPDFLFYAKTLPETTITKQFDFSSYTFTDLIKLKNKLNLCIWKSYSWDKIIIPAELYQIGTDIPEGTWTITSPENYTQIAYGTKLYEKQMNLTIYDDWSKEIESPSYSNYKEGEDISSLDLTVTKGSYLAITENTCAALSPSSGKKPSLGFKKYASEENNNTSNDDQAIIYQLFTLKTDSVDNAPTTPGNITATGSPASIAKIVFNETEYEIIDYEDVARNPENNKGKKIYFIGNVVQVSESVYGYSTVYRVKIDNSDDIVYVKKYTKTEPRILEDDHVIVCGTCTGLESYQSVLGGTITIPSCTADDISDASNLYSRIPNPISEQEPNSESSTEPTELSTEPTHSFRQDDPIIITSCNPGETPSINMKNKSDKTAKQITFRCRYYDKDDMLLFPDTKSSSTQFNQEDWSTLSSTAEIHPNYNSSIFCRMITPFQVADHVDIAIQYIIFDDDTTYYVPESDLYWFSSKQQDYINKSQRYCIYEYPNQETFDKANSFSLGIYYYYIYPEFINYFNVNDAGLLISEINSNSVFKKLGVESGDIIISCDGISFLDDGYILERGKAKLVDGSNIDLILSRNGEKYTISITPEIVSRNEQEQ